jgi:hypothetical protein
MAEWPEADRLGWAKACQPAQRLKRGGAASHLATVSQADIANRYGLFLDYLQRSGQFDLTRRAAALVTAENVHGFVTELQARVRSVTVWNSIYKLRRAAQLIAPAADFGWLTEIEKDIALVIMPRSKADRLVLTERLVEAGLTLIQEAETFGKIPLARAAGARNGLIIGMLACIPFGSRTLRPSRSRTPSSMSAAGGGSTFHLRIPSPTVSMNVRFLNSSRTWSTATSKRTVRSCAAVLKPPPSGFLQRLAGD